jgi:hypothetical protein
MAWGMPPAGPRRAGVWIRPVLGLTASRRWQSQRPNPLSCGFVDGQGAALDPPKAEGLWNSHDLYV